MAIPKFMDDLAIISKLSDNPNTGDGLSAEELKARFDAAPLAIQNYINTILIPNLDKIVDVDALLKNALDATLTLEGKAAEANATGKAIEAVKKITENIKPGASEEQIAQIQANADAIAALPITVREDGFTEIIGLPQGTGAHTVVDGNKYTMRFTLDDGSTSVSEITVENGYPTKIVTDGVEIPLTWEFVKAVLSALDLFNGEDNSQVTGGWVSCAWDTNAGYRNEPTPTIEDGAMTVKLQRGSLQANCGVSTGNLIDLTNVSKITMKFDTKSAATTATYKLVCGSTNTSAPTASKELVIAGDASSQTIELDVSGVSGECYVGFTIYHEGALNCVTTLSVKELVMG